MVKMTLNQIRAKTIQWFNETFGTALEDVPEGDTGMGRSCVLANALNQNVNPKIRWNVGTEEINAEYYSYDNHIFDPITGKYLHIPVMLGNECMSIEEREWKSAPKEYEDFSSTLHSGEPIPLPDYVSTFITAFDWQMYPDLKTHDKTIDWYDEIAPVNMPGYHIKESEYEDDSKGIFIIDKPIPDYHNPILCPRKDDYNPDFPPARGLGEGYCTYCDEAIAV